MSKQTARLCCHPNSNPLAVDAVQTSPHRVEVAVVCWPITLDRDDQYWTVLYCLQVCPVQL
jgi:hypothetical protein